MKAVTLAAATLLFVSSWVAAAQRPWSVEDSAAVRYVVNDWEYPENWGFSNKEVIQIAPDGRQFFFIVHWGDLSCDCERYELAVYAVDDVRRQLSKRGTAETLQPRRTLKMSSTGWVERPAAIYEAQWEDAETVIFMGTRDSGATHSSGTIHGLYRFSVNSGTLSLLSDASHDVAEYDIRGQSVLYNAQRFAPLARNADGEPEDFSQYPLQPIRGGGLGGAGLAPYFGATAFSNKQTAVFARGSDGTIRAVSPFVSTGPVRQELKPRVSPDGRWGVATSVLQRGEIPAEWSRYEGLEAPYALLRKRQYARLRRVLLVDMSTGVARTMIDAPLGPTSTAIDGDLLDIQWSHDSKRVKLANLSLPLNEAVEERRQTGYVMDYEVSTGQWSVIGKVAPRSPRLSAGRAPNKRASLPAGMKVTLRESVNDPPIVIASNGTREVALMQADPALQGIERARQVPVQWTERDGHVEKGGLLLPPQGVGIQPYPLVIQISFYQPDYFRPDGSARTAFAAQALAAQGMAVLQITNGLQMPQVKQSRKVEGPLMIERVDAAVAQLAGQGLIDVHKVGLVGFSRTGYEVHYIVTHPGKIPPAAAIVADSASASYVEYVTETAVFADGNFKSFFSAGFEKQFGGSFWANKAEWLEGAPGFSIDKVQTPVLFTYNGTFAPHPVLEMLGAYRINNKPVDVLLLPRGTHQLILPRQRVASMQATVDWMAFWLLGREDGQASKTEQYWYWRELRKIQLSAGIQK